MASTPLNVDDNTTILFHFDNSIEDSETDQHTIITTKEISYHSSGGIISIPRCSISLLTLQRFPTPPTSNHPNDIVTTRYGTETINWTLNDIYEGSQYQIIANNTVGSEYVWRDWTPWATGVELYITINRSAPGKFQYTIIYNNTVNKFGLNDSIIVIISDSFPTSNYPDDFTTTTIGIETINWILNDDWDSGQYRVMANNTVGSLYIVVNWKDWVPSVSLNVPINRSSIGTFQYMIQYTDAKGNSGIPDYVIVKIIEPEETVDDDDSDGDDNGRKESGAAIPGYNLNIIYYTLIIGSILTLKRLRKARPNY